MGGPTVMVHVVVGRPSSGIDDGAVNRPVGVGALGALPFDGDSGLDFDDADDDEDDEELLEEEEPPDTLSSSASLASTPSSDPSSSSSVFFSFPRSLACRFALRVTWRPSRSARSSARLPGCPPIGILIMAERVGI